MKINVIAITLLSVVPVIYVTASTNREATLRLNLNTLAAEATVPSDTAKQSQILEDFVPPHATFKDKNGNLLPLTGAQLNALI
jgi:hypothetical protein